MARLRISAVARDDLAQLLVLSERRWGEAGRAKYAAQISLAMRRIARSPTGLMTHDRQELGAGIRSLHVKHARGARTVHQPVHVLFYRVADGVVELVRVLHERMEPSRALASE